MALVWCILRHPLVSALFTEVTQVQSILEYSRLALIHLQRLARTSPTENTLGPHSSGPLQLQLPHHGTTLWRSSWEPLAHPHLSNRCPIGAPPCTKHAKIPQLHLLQFWLSYLDALYTERPRTSELSFTSALALLPVCPLCRESYGHGSPHLLQLWPLNQGNPSMEFPQTLIPH